MAGKCSQSSCHPDTGCNVEGCDDVTECKYYDKSFGENESTQSSLTIAGLTRVPWTGNTLGIDDLNFLTASSKPIVIGVTGAASAGKTTFLASLYCLIRGGDKIGNYHFAGSLTLNGWEDISWYLAWNDKGKVQFPPHTTSNAGRVPGLLHLSLRNIEGEKLDLIFTDAPGEWFDNWRTNTNGESAKGAKWIHKNSNSFLLFADCEMLEGTRRGIAKQQIISVADRIIENIEQRPFGLVWSKSDFKINDVTKNQITSHIKQSNPFLFSEFEISVDKGEKGVFHQSILDAVNWIIISLKGNTNTKPLLPSLAPNDLFLSKRVLNE